MARAIAFLTRSPSSPFYGRVQRGLEAEGSDLLPWTVLASLVSMFRELKGGRLFGQELDFADLWGRRLLPVSGIVAADSLPEARDEWRHDDGPWREVFIQFFSAVRDRLADQTDEEAENFWGNPRSSNLFNKISLTILAADFFAFLTDGKHKIDSADEIPGYVADWLEDVDPRYFARSWELEGVKKDAPGTRNQWADLWARYRRDPSRLPPPRLFRKVKGS